MSNGDTRVDVSSEGEFHLKLAMELALIYHTDNRQILQPGRFPGATHWMVRDNGIWFAWAQPSNGDTDLTAFPARLGIDALAGLALGWLKTSGDYGPEPHCDGHCARGWRLVSHFGLMPNCRDQFYLSFGVMPEWMEYHK